MINQISNRVKQRYEDIYLKNNKVCIAVDGKEEIVADGMGIDVIKTDIDSCKKESMIYYYDGGIRKVCSMDRSDYLNPTNLISQQSIGMDVMRDNCSILCKHFRNEEELAKRENIHKRLGFGMYNEKLIYKHHKCVGIDSTYEGEKEIKPKGSREIYVKMIKEDVVGHPPLELIVSISLSSVLLGYIGEELSLDTQIVHLYGNSTTGKSTALKLAISLFGYPDVKKNGLFSTYNATENALIKQLEGIKGVPFAFDEISMSKINNFSQMIYKIANGVEKSRLNSKSEQIKKEPWLTTIMSNGEKSLVGSADKNAGIHVRVLEFESIVWTKNSEHSEKINSIILDNYGHLGFEFAQYLMDLGKEYINEEYYKTKSKLKSIFEKRRIKDNFIDRRINKIAIIILTMQLFERMMNIKMNRNKVLQLILNAEIESIKQRNFDKSFMKYFKEYVSANAVRFSKSRKIDNVRDYIGNIKRKDNYLEFEILQEKFKEIVKEGGFEDDKVVLKELKKSGYLDCEKDRYTRKRETQAGIKIPLIVIKIPTGNKKNKVS
ncbi:DUF927 domain-containing protein [Romboutsia timonensis]|uniref:DUF927 domain-containing protein n=1 Tax=Romboutsia timonensis TaxID=1776391 RepID=UPI002A7F4472|nr:DUF927 domain-containing protein [Romboutsia timonensis]MDY3959611.1 DUF927 domain-containing protein [Romboutsia timonensis]